MSFLTKYIDYKKKIEIMKYIKLYENFNEFDLTAATEGFFQSIFQNLLSYSRSNDEKDLDNLLDALKVMNKVDRLKQILDELKNKDFDTLLNILGSGGENISEEEFKRTNYYKRVS
jgi:hypothetical protein